MFRDVSSCNTYDYGDAVYWDARYIQEGGSFDWYQRYSDLKPFLRHHFPLSSTILMVGCGNAVISEDMVKDGYEEIVNIDISSVAIDIMRRKYEYIPQLKYMQMDVRDMSFFSDESFDGVIDKGTLDSLMCGTDAPISASQMLAEVCRLWTYKIAFLKIFESSNQYSCFISKFSLITPMFFLCRLLKPGGTYMMITYGDPTVRMPHLSKPVYNWKITLYNIPRPGFKRPEGSTSSKKSLLEPIPLTEAGLLPADWVLEDPDSHFIYICRKVKDADV